MGALVFPKVQILTQSDPSATSISLIELAKTNDSEAWRKLAEIYTPLVFSWARRGGLQDQDAADLLQDVFRLVSKNLGRFEKVSPQDTFRGWLWTITRNEVRGYYRKLARPHEIAQGGSDAKNQMSDIPDWVTDEADGDEIERDESTEIQLIRGAVDLIRQDFQDNTWNAFWRSTVEGESTAEIAADLNMKPNAIRQAKLRVLSRFREVLDF